MKLYINGCSYASGFAAEDTNKYEVESAWTHRIADQLNAESLTLDCSPARSIWYTCESMQKYIKAYTSDKSELKVIAELTDPAYANLPVIYSKTGQKFKPSYFITRENLGKKKLVFQLLETEQALETGDESLFEESDVKNLYKIIDNYSESFGNNPASYSISAYRSLYDTAELLNENNIDFIFTWISINPYVAESVILNEFPLLYEKYKRNIISPRIMNLYKISKSAGLINAFNHPTAEGHKVIAETLHEYIMKNNIFHV